MENLITYRSSLMTFVQKVCLACGLICSTLTAGGISREEVTEQTARRNAGVQSLFIEYRMTSKLLVSPEDAKREMNVIMEVDDIKTIAFKGDKRLSSVKRATATTPEISDDSSKATLSEEQKSKIESVLGKIAEKPVRKPAGQIVGEKAITCSFDGTDLYQWYNEDKVAHVYGDDFIKRQDSDSGYINQDFMTVIFHSLPDVFSSKNTRADRRIPDIFGSDQPSIIRELPEQIDGANCVVIDLGKAVTAWCDPDLNYSVRRWILREDGTNRTLWQQDMSDFSEVTQGFWIPHTAVRLRWVLSKSPERLQKDPAMEYRYSVLNVHANDLPDSMFTPVLPVGTHINDFANGIELKPGVREALSYRVPAEGASLDKAAATAVEYRKAAEKASTAGRADRSIWMWVINSIAVAVFIAAIAIRFWQKKRHPPVLK